MTDGVCYSRPPLEPVALLALRLVSARSDLFAPVSFVNEGDEGNEDDEGDKGNEGDEDTEGDEGDEGF